MPIGIVSDDDFLKELTSTSSTKEVVPSVPSSVQKVPSIVDIISPPVRGRKSGDTNVPDSLRQIIGETHLLDGRDAALELASDFGISPSSVSAYAKGATSTTTYHETKPSIIQHINKSRERAIKRASKTLNGALKAISQEKLDYADPKDLSVIAKNMSGIIKDLIPEEKSDKESGAATPQFVIFAPTFRTENSFESIVVNE
jgi:hypothetical protein